MDGTKLVQASPSREALKVFTGYLTSMFTTLTNCRAQGVCQQGHREGQSYCYLD
ncbi:BgTH12-02559 [Blumeria graminis f. sp. triticale]|uniref:BgtE-20092 n=3 Tax=Blumeria graminis TaxID=34373 RepID=A0A9X9QDD4_BLUGR|nr:BgTH12-02559 [Blumeria graminis f. sp. triticale]VDB88681.1 BgtE-20092 [Blumeria graminis f. sp. tritici]